MLLAPLLLTALPLTPGLDTQPAAPDPAEHWWELAFQMKDWDAAALHVKEQGTPGARALTRILALESAAAHLTDPEGGFPSHPRIRAGVLANHREAWALAAAFEDAPRGSLSGALDRAAEHSRRGYPDRQLARIVATRHFLLEQLGGSDPRGRLAGEETTFAGTTVLRGGSLPAVVSGRVVLLAGSYRFKEAVHVPGDAELWIERGSTLTPTGENARLLVRGALRIFGAPGEPVVIGGKREWEGMEYKSDIQHVLTDVRVRGARSGIAVKRSRLHLLDSVVEDCALGIDANTFNVWCESVRIADCTDAGVRQRHGGGQSFLRDCSLIGNEVGLRLSEEGNFEVRSTEFERNAVPIRAPSPRAALIVRASNFLGKAPLELHPERPFDLRENFWGTKTPNFKREVRYSGNAKHGDALLEPALKQAARAGAPDWD